MQLIHRNSINPVLQPCSIKLLYKIFGFHKLTSLAIMTLESHAESLEHVIVLRNKCVCVLGKIKTSQHTNSPLTVVLLFSSVCGDFWTT